jgi:hypothetical protein
MKRLLGPKLGNAVASHRDLSFRIAEAVFRRFASELAFPSDKEAVSMVK